MALLEDLIDKYGYNEPIYLSDVQYGNYSRPWIAKEFKKMVDKGEIKRFDTGIYYFPQKLFFGDSFLDSRKVVERRFLRNGNEIYGYVAGISLLNQVGLSTQVPNLIELVTNKEATRVRDIRIGNQRVRVRRSRTKITKENAKALQFLDLMNSINPVVMDETERLMLRKYILSSGVTRDSVMKHTRYFPAKAVKNLVDSGAVYDLS